MSKIKSHKFSIRLLLDLETVNSLNDLSEAFLTSRLSLIRKYIFLGLTTDLEVMKEGITRLKNIEATKKELNIRVKKQKGIATSSTDEPLMY
jgi:hypothetical protein